MFRKENLTNFEFLIFLHVIAKTFLDARFGLNKSQERCIKSINLRSPPAHEQTHWHTASQTEIPLHTLCMKMLQAVTNLVFRTYLISPVTNIFRFLPVLGGFTAGTAM
jgi:hypothetical protein